VEARPRGGMKKDASERRASDFSAPPKEGEGTGTHETATGFNRGKNGNPETKEGGTVEELVPLWGVVERSYLCNKTAKLVSAKAIWENKL